MTTDRIICRITPAEQDHLTTIAEAIRRAATCHADRFPTRSRALREAIRIAAEQVAGAVPAIT